MLLTSAKESRSIEISRIVGHSSSGSNDREIEIVPAFSLGGQRSKRTVRPAAEILDTE